jgi:transposase InsO family protein
MAYRYIKANQGRYTIKEMVGLLGVSRSAYYKWIRFGISSQKKDADAELLKLIRQIVEKHYRRYGSPRVHRELRNKYGIRVSKKKIARLMRENGLNARKRRKFIKTTDSRHSFPVCENILNRDFYAEKAGQKWVSDITYLRTKNGWVYLTAVLDLWDRKIIGWALSEGMDTAQTTISAFQMAVKNCCPSSDLIFHSDRGVQYCAESFREVLRKWCPSLIQSMSRKGNVWDNACMESFFKTLKWELDTLDGKHSKAEVRQSVFMYIETYYNRIRMHSVLDYIAPNELCLKKAA